MYKEMSRIILQTFSREIFERFQTINKGKNLPQANTCFLSSSISTFDADSFITDSPPDSIPHKFLLFESEASKTVKMITLLEDIPGMPRIILIPSGKFTNNEDDMTNFRIFKDILNEAVTLTCKFIKKYPDYDFYVVGYKLNGIIAQHLSRVFRIGGASFNSYGINDNKILSFVPESEKFLYDHLHPKFYNHILENIIPEKKNTKEILYFGEIMAHTPSNKNYDLEKQINFHICFSSTTIKLCSHVECFKKANDPIPSPSNCTIL